jgi:hypothetical protein
MKKDIKNTDNNRILGLILLLIGVTLLSIGFAICL